MSTESISPDGLRKLMAEHHERDYRVVDVREPGEFTQSHIPGALSLPLSGLVQDMSALAGERDLVFYCHSGGRSAAAAMMMEDEAICQGRLYNLTGGMVSWDGGRVTGVAPVDVFAVADHPIDLMKIAINLEKGAMRFYQLALNRQPGSPYADTFAKLAKAEVGHARLVYSHWQQMAPLDASFDELFERMSGDIMEGGRPVDEALVGLSTGPDAALRLLESALGIEHAAYDLYRTMGDQSTVPSASRVAFISLAQAEKSHLQTLVRALVDSLTE